MQQSPHYKLFHQLVDKSYHVLQFIQGKNANHSCIITTEWVPQISLEDLYKMQPLNLQTLTKVPELLEEFQEESMLYKVNVHACVCYLISEECKKLEMSYEKWLNISLRSSKILPSEWFIHKIMNKYEVWARARKSKSVKPHEMKLVGRKASCSPDKYLSHWQSTTPSKLNTGKITMDFSRKLNKRIKIL